MKCVVRTEFQSGHIRILCPMNICVYTNTFRWLSWASIAAIEDHDQKALTAPRSVLHREGSEEQLRAGTVAEGTKKGT